MARELAGNLDGNGLRIGIIVAQFNEMITARLLEGARDALVKHGVREDAITIVSVPGSIELPQAADRMAKSDAYDALVTLGCVIKGETAHFEYVAQEAARKRREEERAKSLRRCRRVCTPCADGWARSPARSAIISARCLKTNGCARSSSVRAGWFRARARWAGRMTDCASCYSFATTTRPPSSPRG